LLRALDALRRLSPEEWAAPLAALRDPRHDLETVEELLWITGWRVAKVGRGTQLRGTNGDVDWCLQSGGFTIHLEAKFRHSDWPRVIDHDIFISAGNGFLSKAAHKFPVNAADGALHVIGNRPPCSLGKHWATSSRPSFTGYVFSQRRSSHGRLRMLSSSLSMITNGGNPSPRPSSARSSRSLSGKTAARASPSSAVV
jgi:hypothetical protein